MPLLSKPAGLLPLGIEYIVTTVILLSTIRRFYSSSINQFVYYLIKEERNKLLILFKAQASAIYYQQIQLLSPQKSLYSQPYQKEEKERSLSYSTFNFKYRKSDSANSIV